jgi:hypothetical protein
MTQNIAESSDTPPRLLGRKHLGLALQFLGSLADDQ